MKKQVLALAVLGALATAAHAADTVTVYGQVNVGLYSVDSGPVTNTKVDAANTGSRIGFRGVEDLGGGLKAAFVIETSIRADDAPTSSFGSREAWVRLQGDFGTVGLGRGKTPYTNLIDVLDNNDGTNQNPLVLADRALNKSSNLGGGIANSRFNNSIRYDSPKVNGFTAAVQYGAGEDKTATVNASNGLSGSLTYADGPLMVGAAFTSQNNGLGGTAPTADKDLTAWNIIGSYKFVPEFTLLAGYNHAKQSAYGTTKELKRDTWGVQGQFVAGAATYKLGLMSAAKIKEGGNSLASTDFTRYILGLKYALSKRTNALAEFAGDNNKGSMMDTRSLMVGLMHSF